MPIDNGNSGSLQPALSVKRRAGPLGCAGCFGYLFVFGFVSLFLAAGLVMLWVAFLAPTLHIIAAQSWTETPCTIVSSEVVGDKTYNVKIRYDYEFGGQKHTGDRYWFITGRSSGRKGKEAIVGRYPPGKQTVCYVNPGDPDESVIHRGFSGPMWWGLFSLPFLAVGLGGYYGLLFARRKPAALQPPDDVNLAGRPNSPVADARSAATVVVPDSEFDDDDLREEPGPVTLAPESSRLGAFVGLTIFALIWNGVIFLFLMKRFPDWQQGKWQWFPEIILFAFAFVGLLILLGAIHPFLALFNPIPVLTLSRRLIPLGQSALLTWQLEGSVRSIRSLKLSLKGVEEARYTRGTDTHTDTAVFLEEVCYETQDQNEIASGQAEIRIPTDTMHSFSGGNNRIKWQVQLQGDIPNWPDVTASFPIRVAPHE